MSGLWSISSNINTPFMIINEGETVNHPLPVDHSSQISILSGKLPKGLSLHEAYIKGIASPVYDSINNIVVFRSIKGNLIEDRSLLFTVVGKNSPQWVTPPGLLKLDGVNDFITDGFVCSYQFNAYDPDQEAGEQLKYYISSGELPPGLVLRENGLLVGISGIIVYDGVNERIHYYDYPHPDDFTMGYDSRFYDITTKQEEIDQSKTVIKISKIYYFDVSVYDGRTAPVSRSFQINVVGDLNLTGSKVTDITLITDADFFISNSMDTSVDYFPVWITNDDLGFIRSNNHSMIYLDCIDTLTMTGYNRYILLDKNHDGTDSILPGNMQLDAETGIIHGTATLIYSVYEKYQFTIRAQSSGSMLYTDKMFTLSVIDDNYSIITWKTQADLGVLFPFQTSLISIQAVTSNSDLNITYTVVDGELPLGLTLMNNGNLVGKVPSLYNELNEYQFTVKASDQRNPDGVFKKFKIKVDYYVNLQYADVWIQPMMANEYRQTYFNIISDTNIFNQQYIYRSNDPEFGVISQPAILLFSGLYNDKMHDYLQSSIKLSRFLFHVTGINIAPAIGPDGTIEYEMIYFELTPPIQEHDALGYPTSIYDVRNKLLDVGELDIRHERLWYSSIQRKMRYQPNASFVLPIAYCNTGSANMVLRSLLQSNHQLYDFTILVDRMYVEITPSSEKRFIYFVNEEMQSV